MTHSMTAYASRTGQSDTASWHWDMRSVNGRGLDIRRRLPDGMDKGYFVKPTVLAGVNNQMTVAREEIFGPVLVIIGYDTLDEAVAIANDTPYGLAAYVQGTDTATLHSVANRLRAGQVILNGAPTDMMAPFGGFKQSGNGREWGDVAFGEFLETKAVLGHSLAAA